MSATRGACVQLLIPKALTAASVKMHRASEDCPTRRVIRKHRFRGFRLERSERCASRGCERPEYTGTWIERPEYYGSLDRAV